VAVNSILLSLYAFYTPTNFTYTYGNDEVCVVSPAFLPSLVSQTQPKEFQLSQKPVFTLMGTPIFSYKVCATPLLIAGSTESVSARIRQFGIPFDKHITIRPGTLPSMSPRLLSEETLSNRTNLVFDTPNASPLLAYSLEGNMLSTKCVMQDTTVICKVSELGLLQGREYDLTLYHELGSTREKAFSQRFKTVEPVGIARSSIVEASTIYDKPQSVRIDFTKPLRSAPIVTMYAGIERKPYEIISRLNEDAMSIDVNWSSDLPRGELFYLEIPKLVATDGAYLDQPYALSFATSVGPKVVSVNIDTYKVSTSADIILSFDQVIEPKQSFAELVYVDGHSAQAVADGTTLRLRMNTSFERCSDYTLRVSEMLQSIHGISGGNAYSLSFRTLCQSVSSIGTSVQGSAITSYSFGSGPHVILFVGVTHGNEKSTKSTLESWIDHLERNPSQVPGDKKVVIIPILNPDGYKVGSRTNANNVDLNRNFPANNWKPSVVMPGGETLEFGGGSSALSEPESSALASYVQTVRPRFVLTYHSWGGIVMGNGSGDSLDFADRYAEITGYADESLTPPSSVFTHDTTGAFEDWLHDKEALPALLIELNTHNQNEINRHRPAMVEALKL
jgi:protein MpaA